MFEGFGTPQAKTLGLLKILNILDQILDFSHSGEKKCFRGGETRFAINSTAYLVGVRPWQHVWNKHNGARFLCIGRLPASLLRPQGGALEK